MSSIWGNNIKISIFGESHGESIGAVIDGLPPGEKIDFNLVRDQIRRRMPRKDNTTTTRNEKDEFRILSGVYNEFTSGTPLCVMIDNKDVTSRDYQKNRFKPRPGHADYTGYIRYKGYEDFRGGGHFSGRLTAVMTIAGAISRQILKTKGIVIGSHVSSVGEINDDSFDLARISSSCLESLSLEGFPVINQKSKKKMLAKIQEVSLEGDSIGGTIECAIIGVKAGIGDPIFDNIESKIASIVFGIPGVKGIELGNGFSSAKLKGSQNNDSFIFKDGKVVTVTNNHGGILGGISSGMPIVFKVAIKPTASISKIQKTVDIIKKQECQIEISGRHDPCIVSRAAAVVESAAAIAMLDMILPYIGDEKNDLFS